MRPYPGKHAYTHVGTPHTHAKEEINNNLKFLLLYVKNLC